MKNIGDDEVVYQVRNIKRRLQVAWNTKDGGYPEVNTRKERIQKR